MPLSLKSPSSLLPNPTTATATRTSQEQYRKSSIKPPRVHIYFKAIWAGGGGEGLIETGNLFERESYLI